MSKCVLDVWEGRIPTCMAGYIVCDEEKCPDFIQEVKMKLNNGWISCSEKLPDEYGCYLVAWRPLNLIAEDIIKNTGSSPHYYEILAFEPVFGGGWIDDIEQCNEYEILAWQPLPEPYKEVGK